MSRFWWQLIFWIFDSFTVDCLVKIKSYYFDHDHNLQSLWDTGRLACNQPHLILLTPVWRLIRASSSCCVEIYDFSSRRRRPCAEAEEVYHLFRFSSEKKLEGKSTHQQIAKRRWCGTYGTYPNVSGQPLELPCFRFSPNSPTPGLQPEFTYRYIVRKPLP